MTESTLTAQIDAARAYEVLFVPALFGQWAPIVADAARVQPGQRVLDIACGTGVLAREAAARVGANGQVVGLDPSPGMLAVAEALAPEIEWREGSAGSLPFADHTFDAVVSQFGLMFFPDRRQALREMLRVMAPGGRLALAVWDVLDNIPAYAAEAALVKRLAGDEAASALQAPFVLGNRRELEALLGETGASAVEVATYRGTARFPSIRTMVEVDLRGWLPVMGVMLPEAQIQQILDEAETALRPYADREGAVQFELSAHVATATR
jgi:SAM-dependent methyltransferase